MKVKENCVKIKFLGKEIGKYKYSLSNVKDTKYGRTNKNKFEKYDDY